VASTFVDSGAGKGEDAGEQWQRDKPDGNGAERVLA
jgi:hypothetical protein